MNLIVHPILFSYIYMRIIIINHYHMTNIICQICNTNQTPRSMAMHLRWEHKIKTQDYVKKYGEFIPKKINQNNLKNNSQYKCKICNKSMMHNRQLMYHLTKHHPEISQEDYIVKFEFNGIHPICACGCGQPTQFLLANNVINNKGNSIEGYFRKYIKGHWDWIVPGFNTHNEYTKDLIKQASTKRAQKEIDELGYQKMHSPEVLEKSRQKDKITYIQKIESDYNITLTNPEEIYTSSKPSNYFKFKCLKCLNEWKQKFKIPNCQCCNPPSHLEVSQEEINLRNFILQYFPNAKFNIRNLIKPYEIDIYIEELNLAIEYNGLYWHSEKMGKHKEYHINKTKMCQDIGIHLIHIFSDEWLNKTEIVKSRLLNIFQKTPNKIYGRKCNIKQINSKTKKIFLNNNHIQGNDKSQIYLGLYYNEELISVMTFGSPRIAMGNKNKNYNKNSYELIRFCNKLNTNVVGGASKLLKYFIKNYKPEHIFSFADLRWSNPNQNLYINIGFKFISESKPGYWYTKNYLKRYHRFNFNKNRLKKMGFDIKKTENEIMKEAGYEKIWDCGVLRFEYY